MYTRRVPFCNLRHAYQVIGKVLYGDARPERPSEMTGRSMSDGVWQLVQNCWDTNPQNRPLAATIARRLKVFGDDIF